MPIPSNYSLPSTFEPLIDLDTAARLLQLHPDTVKKKAISGEIPGRKVGRSWKFRISELNAWLRDKAIAVRSQNRGSAK